MNIITKITIDKFKNQKYTKYFPVSNDYKIFYTEYNSLIYANKQRLVISGITIHETKKDDSGYLLNENN